MDRTQQELKLALFKLAFFEPNLLDEKNNHILDYLILDCLEAYSPLYDCGLDEVSKYIKTTFNVEFDQAEVLVGARRLEKKEFVKVIEPKSRNECERIKSIKPSNEKNQKQIIELEEKVFLDWSDSLKKKYTTYINDENKEKLIETFQTFLTKMLIKHGKESVATLYPDNPKTQEWIDKIHNEIIRDLPKLGGELDLILQIEIPQFFKDSNQDRKKYINGLFNASFLWHLIQIDDSCTEYFKETTKGQLLILDNNILFSLIGLDGPKLLGAIHNLLKYANLLGYKLVVTTKTLDEFFGTIRHKSEKAFNYSRYSKDVATVAINVLDSNNFIVSYLKEFVKNGLTIGEFAIEKSHIKNILNAFNITITDDYRKEIESSQELLDEESLLRESCDNSFSQNVIEHDAFHRILIKKIRQHYVYKYSDAKAWFLTHDSKLPIYAHYALKGKKALPFCITTNEWLQINRPFIKRTENPEEFENSFQLLVTQPFLRSVLSNFKVDKIKEKLLLNLNRYQNIGSQLAFDLVTDVHFLYTLSEQSNDKNIEEKVEEAIININQNLREENKEIYEVLEKQENDYKEDINQLNENIQKIQDEIKVRDESQQKLLETIDELRKSLKYSEDKNLGKDEEIIIITSKLTKQSKLTLWIIFSFLLIIGSLFIWFFETIITWNWLEQKTTKVLLKICANFILLAIGLNITLPKHWVLWLTGLIAFIIAILSISAI